MHFGFGFLGSSMGSSNHMQVTYHGDCNTLRHHCHGRPRNSMALRNLFVLTVAALAVPALCMSSQLATTADYMANHSFAVFFTFVAAASQGLGGLIAVLGMKEYGASVAHLMSFSTGVMLYLSFMDIMFETTQKIGDAASLAFFTGMGIFMLLEVCLPEVESMQLVETFGLTAWTPSPKKEDLSTNPEPTIRETRMPESPVKPSATRHRHTRNSSEEGAGSKTPGRNGQAKVARGRSKSPPPSEKRRTFRQDGEKGLTEHRKRSISFSGMMVLISISLHNIPEGIAVYLTCLKGVKSGLPLAVAMCASRASKGGRTRSRLVT